MWKRVEVLEYHAGIASQPGQTLLWLRQRNEVASGALMNDITRIDQNARRSRAVGI